MISNSGIQNLAQSKILVIGGGGFIGQALVKRLINLDAEVVSLTRTGARSIVQSDKLFEMTVDVREFKELAIIRSISFDYIFNIGGYVDHSQYLNGGRAVIDAHYCGLLNLLSNIDLSGLKKFVQVGSSDEYGNLPAPQKENLRESPISPYSAAKVGATHLIQALSRTEGFPGVVVRLFLVYGPGQGQQRFLPQVIKGCLRREIFPTSAGRQLRDFCYIDDVVEGLILSAVIDRAVGRVINIASGNPVSIRSVIEKVVRLAGGGRPEFGAHAYRTGENMNLHADVGVAEELLGWRAKTSLEDGLQRTILWYKRSLGV